MCDNDYRSVRDPAQRRIKALKEMAAAHIPRELAVAYVALSEGESRYLWTVKRPLKKHTCCANVVGLEPSEVKRLHADPAFLKWINDNTGGVVVSGNNTLSVPTLSTVRNAIWFEKALADENMNILKMFSIGPTQLLIDSSRICGQPKTIAEIKEWYLTVDMHDRMANFLTYLTPKRYTPKGCRDLNGLLPDGTEAAGVPWLAAHGGSPEIGLKLWNGDAAVFGARQPYKTIWSLVNTSSEAIFAGK